MEHSISSAIRTVGAQICRRLDVLIEAAGKPPVRDIEGTPAPRKPLAGNAAIKKEQAAPAPAPAPAPAKKRGRPPKNAQAAASNTATTTATDSDEATCEASLH
jgi:hypothetical protein